MTPSEQDALNLSVLMMLAAAAEIGLQQISMMPRLRLDYPSLTEPALDVALRSLADRKFIISHQPTLGGLRWKILSQGRAALQEAGLA